MPSKYRAIKTQSDGYTFASAKEASRYNELKLLERAGNIDGLRLQPRFPLRVCDSLICTYVGDFSYLECFSGKNVVEDVKGYKTREYLIKRKLFLALYPKLKHREV